MSTVLIVDDIAMNRKLIRAILTKALANITILEAQDGFEALIKVYENKVSVILLDIMMPNKDGIEVLTELKQKPEYEKIPVIMCSAVHEVESIEKALSLGALDYFTKPLKEEEIRITLPLKVKNALKVFDRENRINELYDQIQGEMLLAEELQKTMVLGNADYGLATVYGKYIPCEKIGGDLLCSKKVKEDVWFFIADVAGHGIASAMLSVMLNSVFQLRAGELEGPGALLGKMNEYLLSCFSSTNFGLVSAFAGCIRGNTLVYANAGHPYPLFYKHKEAMIETLTANGYLLGLLDDIEYEEREIPMEQEDAILCYTDGLFDKGNNNGYSAWGLVHAFCLVNVNFFREEIPELIDEMVGYFRYQGSGPFIDDVAVIAVKKH